MTTKEELEQLITEDEAGIRHSRLWIGWFLLSSICVAVSAANLQVPVNRAIMVVLGFMGGWCAATEWRDSRLLRGRIDICKGLIEEYNENTGASAPCSGGCDGCGCSVPEGDSPTQQSCKSVIASEKGTDLSSTGSV